jgi:putative DNA primase/helicase
MMLETVPMTRVQDAIETLTDAEQRALNEHARKLRTLAAGDVLAEMEYHDAMLARWADWLADETTDAETSELAAYAVTDHRRRRELCGAELSRRNHADKLPSGGARSRITRELIDDIKSRADLAELMQTRGVELKTRGNRAQGRCPFHDDKTPSLSVDTARGLWHCFGCHAGGDAVQFVMQFDRVEFVPALRILAERAGVELPDPAPRHAKRATSTDAPSDGPRTVKREPKDADAAPYLPYADILEAYHRAETGDAEILARLFADKIAFDHAENSWHLFQAHAWMRDETGRVEKFVTDDLAAQYLFAAVETKRRDGDDDATQKQIKELYARANMLRYRNKIANVLDRARKQDALALRGDEWDKDALLLGCANGVLNLRYREFEFRDGAPRDYIRTIAPTQWDNLHTPAPRWEQFLQEIFAGDAELIAFVQRWFGYCLTADVSENAFVVLHGEEGRNGKRILTETIARVMGGYATAGEDDLFLDSRDRTAGAPKQFLLDLAAKRLVLLSETKEGARFNLARIKQLAGGDMLKARGMFAKRGIEINPTWKFVLSTNRMPHADSEDAAFFERIFIVRFTQRFVTHPDPANVNEHLRDAKLEQTLRAEASGILAWLVRGCLEWQRAGLNPPESVRVATQEYRAGEDTLAQWQTERCHIAPNAEMKSADGYADYRQWAIDNGLAPMSGTAFGKRMGKRFKREKRGVMVYSGIGLLAE